jgi:hypothetical protein
MEESPSSAPDFSTSTRYIVWKKTDVKAKPYPKRSKEKSPRAAITQPAAVSSTDRAT